MLSGRVAFVSGGASGIGRAVSRVLAREGARVAVADLDGDGAARVAEELPGVTGGGHVGFSADVSDMKSVIAGADRLADALGQAADVVVNSAGITKDGYLLKMSEEQFDKVIQVNLKGTFNVNKVFAERMMKGELARGSIVNISSIIGLTGNKGQTNYAASKAGVVAFTKSAAKELAKFDVRVNCICPGFIRTPMIDTIPEHLQQMLLMQIPLGRMGEPEDIAEAAAFLASDRSKYINGEIMNVNGGLL